MKTTARPPTAARTAAFDALRAVHRNVCTLAEALARSRDGLSDSRDRALAAEIVIGALRWQGQLDVVLAHYLDRPLARLDDDVLLILRLAAYQLLHLERVPPSAATHDAVALARRARKASAGALINAVLRRVAEHRTALPLPARPDPDALARVATEPAAREAALAYLSATLSHPRWLADRWLDRFGFDAAEAWARFNNLTAPTTLRVNTLKISVADVVQRLTTEGVVTRPARYAPDALTVVSGVPLRTQTVRDGLALVQDEASQLVGHLVAPAPGHRVLDCCAAPGGKTVDLAAVLRRTGLLVASDLRAARVGVLKQTLDRCGVCAHVVRADATSPLPFQEGTFDRVLLDAPCSGLGTVRRDPDIKWRRQESDLAGFAALQTRLLHHASAAVAPGGWLVYATCSSEPEENEVVVDRFLDTHPGFIQVTPPEPASSPGAPSLLDPHGCVRTSPAEHELEAFFAAVLRRVGTGQKL